MDKEGYIRITGRIKDLIIRGGENIRPLEVENCLLAHEAVQDACVVGLKDDRYGEVVAAFVRTHPGNELFSADETEGVEELRRWVRSRLSSHLVPKYVIPHVGDFPKTASGKIMKYVVREMGEGWRTWRRVEGVVKERVDGVSEVGCVEVSQAEGERVLAVVVGMEAGKRFCERETGGRVREVVETHCGVGLGKCWAFLPRSLS